jgi:hypothetical protein
LVTDGLSPEEREERPGAIPAFFRWSPAFRFSAGFRENVRMRQPDSTCLLHRAATALAGLLVCTSANPSGADILITEVIPNVTTTATRGDVVELFNTGPGSVDLSGWILTDLDNDPVGGVPDDATFAPALLAVAPLAAGEFAVVELVDAAGTASWQATNYGVRIVAPLVAGSFLGSERDELLLVDDANVPVDFVAWSDSTVAVGADSHEDLSAVTGSVYAYGLTPGGAAWAGIETITSDAEYYADTIDFTAFADVSTWGGGAIRRRSTAGVFDVDAPDGPLQWEAVPRHQATLGNASDDVPATGGLRPIRVTDDLASWLGQIESTSFPHRRIAPLANQMPSDFVPADLARRDAWEDIMATAMSSDWPETFLAASAIGYEVVELFDTATDETFHLLRERFVPGEPGFTGMGTFVFFDGAGVRANVVLEAPHPVHDGDTLEEAALAAGQIRPRVMLIAGTNRKNHTGGTTCDGSFEGGAPRISDVAHHPDNFFHTTHVWLHANLPGMVAIQFHGFCCPGEAPHEAVTDDVIVSNGFESPPPAEELAPILRARIDAQNFFADGVDLTTAAVFGDDADELGATTNLQGRISNGVAPGMECEDAAESAAGSFLHIEQDPDVREEPQHILTALIEALDLLDGEPAMTCSAMPAIGCREAGSGKSSFKLQVSTDGTRDRFAWKWGKGAATDTADFADPVSGAASYHVCVYDDSESLQPLLDLSIEPGGTCSGKACWRAVSTKGFGYRNKTGNAHGVTGVKLSSGAAGKSKVQVKAGGLSLATPNLPLTPPVTVQLLIDAGLGAECWQTTYVAEPQLNDTERFRAKQ